MDAPTMGGEDTTAVDAAITAVGCGSGYAHGSYAAITQGVVSVEVCTVVEVDSTVVVPMAADADNRCSDLP
jgi:protein-L-isoaspartate O-methyltransferase